MCEGMRQEYIGLYNIIYTGNTLYGWGAGLTCELIYINYAMSVPCGVPISKG